MAETVVDLISKKLRLEEGRNLPPCQTKHLPVSGGGVGGSDQFLSYVSKYIDKGVEFGFTKSEAERLARTYGSNIEIVYHLLEENKEDAKKYGLPLELFARLLYGIEHEMVATPIDFLNRRTGAILFNIQLVQQWKKQVCTFMEDKFLWSEQQREQYSLALEECITSAVAPIDDFNAPNGIEKGITRE